MAKQELKSDEMAAAKPGPGEIVVEAKFKEREMAQRLEELARAEEFVVGGEATMEDEVIASISGVAAREVEGVASLGTPSIRRNFAQRLTGAEAVTEMLNAINLHPNWCDNTLHYAAKA